MEIVGVVYLFMIALCSAVENTQEGDPGMFPQDLRDFVRRLAQKQLHTPPNTHPSSLPYARVPLYRTRFSPGNTEVDPTIDLLNYPFQSNEDEEIKSHAMASSSVSAKRPQADIAVEEKSSEYASVDDVNEEEQMERDIDSDSNDEKLNSLKSNIPSEVSTSRLVSTKGEPYALKRQHIETVIKAEDSFSDVYFVAIVAGCCAVGIFGVISAGICFYKLQKSRKAAADVDYPAYGVTGPNKDISSPNGDRKLAQSAQMYHYQHQKQQMIAVEKAGSTKNTSASDVDSEEENEEGDYTVYECPGLAPTGEMEVKNPLFHDDSTPVSPPVLSSKSDSNQNN